MTTSWNQVGRDDLLTAFRKAKADCFLEWSAYVAEAFAEYEEHLFEKLRELVRRLRAGQVDVVFKEAQRPPGVFAKRLDINPKDGVSPTHAFFSDADRAFENLKASAERIAPEFRLVGNFETPMHILSGL